MERKLFETYERPYIKKITELQLENTILTSSVAVDDVQVESTGQEVVTYDFNDNNFNWEWK